METKKQNCGIQKITMNSYSNGEWKATSELPTQNLTELLCGIWQNYGNVENGTERKNYIGLPLCRKNNKSESEQVCGNKNKRIYSNSEIKEN